jgi:hypothetical protein
MLRDPPPLPPALAGQALVLQQLAAVPLDVRAKNLRGDNIDNFEIYLPRVPAAEEGEPLTCSATQGIWVNLKRILSSKNSTVAFIKKSTRSLWASVSQG